MNILSEIKLKAQQFIYPKLPHSVQMTKTLQEIKTLHDLIASTSIWNAGRSDHAGITLLMVREEVLVLMQEPDCGLIDVFSKIEFKDYEKTFDSPHHFYGLSVCDDKDKWRVMDLTFMVNFVDKCFYLIRGKINPRQFNT